MSPRLCRLCGERPVPASRMKVRDYCCYQCRNRLYSGTNTRWRQSAAGRAYERRANARRLFVGHDYHSYVADAETAARIQAHIRGRIHAFVKGQQDRKKAEGAPKG